jgi:hypothetical protein
MKLESQGAAGGFLRRPLSTSHTADFDSVGRFRGPYVGSGYSSFKRSEIFANSGKGGLPHRA